MKSPVYMVTVPQPCNTTMRCLAWFDEAHGRVMMASIGYLITSESDFYKNHPAYPDFMRATLEIEAEWHREMEKE